jgi:hypothetical protein
VSKPRASKSPKARAPAPAPAPAPEEELDVELDETTPTELDRHDLAFLRRVHTFLFHIHRFPHQAKRQAYTQKEHDLGWDLWSVASGRNRPFDHWLAESDQKDQPADISSERLRILKEIDAFENLWFPRMRALIARVIPKKNADRFAAGFFKDLSQQPLGPAVVDSVKTFLNRVEELKKSSEPGALELQTTLHQRGLSPGRGRLLDTPRAAPRRSRREARPPRRSSRAGGREERCAWAPVPFSLVGRCAGGYLARRADGPLYHPDPAALHPDPTAPHLDFCSRSSRHAVDAPAPGGGFRR